MRVGPPPLNVRACRVAGGLLLLGVAVTVAGLFPVYLQGAGSLVSQADQILFHLIPVLAWAAGGVALLVGRPAPARVGAAVAAGSVWIVTFIDLSTIGQLAVSGAGTTRLGFWLELGGNALALAGVSVGLVALRRSANLRADGHKTAPRMRSLIWGLAVTGAAATVVGYLGGWRSYFVTSAALHQSQTTAVSGPFDAAWEVFIGQVLVVAGIGLLPVVAALWERRRAGAALVTGVVAAMAGLVALTVYEVFSPVNLADLYPGESASDLKQLRLHVVVSFTWWFYVAAAGLVVLLAAAAASWRAAAKQLA